MLVTRKNLKWLGNTATVRLLLTLLLITSLATSIGTATAQVPPPFTAPEINPAVPILTIPNTQLLLDQLGQVKGDGANVEVAGRQYDATGAFPVTVTGTAFTASEIKIISSLKLAAGTGEHIGTLDVDIPSPVGGHITLEYSGTAMMSGSVITSGGRFKTIAGTGTFAGVKVDGTYVMSIYEGGSTVGSPVTVSFSAMGIGNILPPPTVKAPGGPGYPTGPLNMAVSAAPLVIEQLGQVKQAPGQLEIKGRIYAAIGAFPVTINGTAFTANEIKVASDLVVKAGAGQHGGTIDVDIDAIPGGHLTLQYRGTGTLDGSTIVSNGTFKTAKTTGTFAGLVADGTYNMNIVETAQVAGSPVSVTITTVTTFPAAPAFAGVGGPGYPTGPLNMSMPASQLLIEQLGQVKEAPGQLEIKGRIYAANGAFPVTINGIAYTANQIKVASDLIVKAGVGQHQGTVDVDIDAIPGGHLALNYSGTGAKDVNTISSNGTFKTGKTTGTFAGLVADGTYTMTIVETTQLAGAPVTVTITTTSVFPPVAAAKQPAAAAAPAFAGVGGPGYPTGPLNMLVNGAQILIEQLGQVKQAPGQLEVKGRIYGANGLFPVTINGTAFAANEIKVASDLIVKAGVGQHQGTVDVDIDAIPGGHITLDYRGTATMVGSTITSNGSFKTAKTTGVFAGLVADGTYDMTIVELGNIVGSPVMVTILTKTTFPPVAAAKQPAAAAAPAFAGVGGPGYPTGPLNMSVPASQLLIEQLGQVKEAPGQLEIKGRIYAANGAFPVTINGTAYTANQIKVASDLIVKAGVGQHQGTVDVDIDAIPGGHLALNYSGTGAKDVNTISSNGTFKTGKTTGTFAGLVADGTYTMTIVETTQLAGAPVTVTITTTSVFPPVAAAKQPAAAAAPAFAGVGGPGYPTGPLNMSMPASQLLMEQLGQVKQAPGQLEIKGRIYAANGTFPVTINGIVYTANQIKVASDLIVKAGVGQHKGTVDVDIDAIPGGHLALQYMGSPVVSGNLITSSGTFKTAKTTGSFAGLVAEGMYNMTIIETATTIGAPVTVTLSTTTP